ncbi:MAG: hypothetical protein AB7S38_00935 [Vulcanimicrobiota bacterium]
MVQPGSAPATLALRGLKGAGRFHLFGRERKRLEAATSALEAIDQYQGREVNYHGPVALTLAMGAAVEPGARLAVYKDVLAQLAEQATLGAAPASMLAALALRELTVAGQGDQPAEAAVASLLETSPGHFSSFVLRMPEVSARQRLLLLAREQDTEPIALGEMLAATANSPASLDLAGRLLERLPDTAEARLLQRVKQLALVDARAQVAAIQRGLEAHGREESSAALGLAMVEPLDGWEDRALVASAALADCHPAWRDWASQMAAGVTRARTRSQIHEAALEGATAGAATPASLAQACSQVLDADLELTPRVQAYAWQVLQRPEAELTGAASLVAAVVERDPDTQRGRETARKMVDRLLPLASPDQAGALAALDRWTEGYFRDSLVNEAQTGLKRLGADAWERLTGSDSGLATRLRNEPAEAAMLSLLAGGLRGLSEQGEGSLLARVLDRGLAAQLPRSKKDFEVDCAAAREGLKSLANSPGELGKCVGLLTQLEARHGFGHPAEKLALLQIGIRYLSEKEPTVGELAALLLTARPLDQKLAARLERVATQTPDLAAFADLLPSPDDELTRSWAQSVEGNCVSVAVIKAALQQYGTGVFDELSPTDDGWRVVMQDGHQLTLSRAELDLARASSNFRGSGVGRRMADACFAVMAKRLQTGKHAPVKSYEKALDWLNNGEFAPNCLRYLGLRQNAYRIAPWKVDDHEAVMVSSRSHCVHVENRGDGSKADHYGRRVDFDGTDTNGKITWDNLALAPRAHPARAVTIP